MSGSEDGKPYLWDTTSAELFNTEFLETAFAGPVSDVQWNQQYHMVAVAGFGDEYPLLIFVWERSEEAGVENMLKELRKSNEFNEINQDQYGEGERNMPYVKQISMLLIY